MQLFFQRWLLFVFSLLFFNIFSFYINLSKFSMHFSVGLFSSILFILFREYVFDLQRFSVSYKNLEYFIYRDGIVYTTVLTKQI